MAVWTSVVDGKSRDRVPTGKLSLCRASLPGLACRWKSHPLLCAIQTTTVRASTPLLEKISTPVSPFLPAKFGVMWQSDRLLMATLTLVLHWGWLCVFVLFCLCGIGAVYVWQRTTWSDSQHWRDLNFLFFFTTMSLWGLCAMPASFANTLLSFDVLPWSELGACQWVCAVRQGCTRLEREAMTLTYLKKSGL